MGKPDGCGGLGHRCSAGAGRGLGVMGCSVSQHAQALGSASLATGERQRQQHGEEPQYTAPGIGVNETARYTAEVAHAAEPATQWGQLSPCFPLHMLRQMSEVSCQSQVTQLPWRKVSKWFRYD